MQGAAAAPGVGEQKEKVAITETQMFRNLEMGFQRAENQTLRRGRSSADTGVPERGSASIRKLQTGLIGCHSEGLLQKQKQRRAWRDAHQTCKKEQSPRPSSSLAASL